MADYAFVHEGRAFTPNRTKLDAEQADAHNDNIERTELWRWAEQPVQMLAYYDERAKTVTTWRGIVLGTITHCNVYRHNFGSRMVSVTVQGTNGATYYGCASYDNGQCVMLHKTTRRQP